MTDAAILIFIMPFHRFFYLSKASSYETNCILYNGRILTKT